MTLRQLRNSLLIIILSLCSTAITHAATIELESSLPEGSSALPGEVVSFDIFIDNEARDQIISTQVRIAYPADAVTLNTFELNDTLFDVPVPSEEGENYIVMGGGSTRGGSSSNRVLIGSVTFTISSNESRAVEIIIDSENTSIMAAETEGIKNIFQPSEGSVFGVGDYLPPKTTTILDEQPTTPSTSSSSEMESGTGAVLHGSAGEQPPVIVDTTIDQNLIAAEAPTNISYQTNGSILTLRWDAMTNTSSYYVYWSTNGRDFIHRTKVIQNQYSTSDFSRGDEVVFVVSGVDNIGRESMRSVAVPVIIGRQVAVTTIPPYIPAPVEQLYQSAPPTPQGTTTSPELPKSGGSTLVLFGLLGIVFATCKAIHNARKKNSMVY